MTRGLRCPWSILTNSDNCKACDCKAVFCVDADPLKQPLVRFFISGSRVAESTHFFSSSNTLHQLRLERKSSDIKHQSIIQTSREDQFTNHHQHEVLSRCCDLVRFLCFGLPSKLSGMKHQHHQVRFKSLTSSQWNDCMLSWDGQTCESDNGWNCLCSNSTAVNQINTCVATSCTNTTDQEAIYGAIAQLCANNGVALTQTQQATFSATSGGSAWPSQFTGSGYGPGGRWNSGNWGDWVSACSTGLPGAPSGWAGGRWGSAPGWGGRGGRGGMSGGPGGYGPWGTKASGINCAAWTTWTAGWGPFSAVSHFSTSQSRKHTDIFSSGLVLGLAAALPLTLQFQQLSPLLSPTTALFKFSLVRHLVSKLLLLQHLEALHLLAALVPSSYQMVCST